MDRWKDLLLAFVLGSVADFPWEMAHSVLYQGMSRLGWVRGTVCCVLASLADGVGIAVIFAAGALLFRDWRWTRHLSAGRVALVVLVGVVIALLTEQTALRLGWWSYGPRMPRVPGTDLGVTPLAQFVLLPPAVLFWALPRWWDRKRRNDEANEHR